MGLVAWLFAILLVAVVSLIYYLDNNSSTAKKERLLRELHKVDDQIGKEANQARRAMNDAAGQSWRNQFE